jgi:ribonucleoside-triphosphate reductase
MAVQVRSLETVEAEIEATKQALANVKGSETEVYSRIVGYYRSVRNWNKGKRDEYDQRKMFVYDGTQVPNHAQDTTTAQINTVKAESATVVSEKTQILGTPDHYEFFARKTCPNCPPVKEYLSGCILPGTYIDVDTEAGLAKAAQMGVFAAPTVIVYDAQNNEIARAHNAHDLELALDTSKVAVMA